MCISKNTIKKQKKNFNNVDDDFYNSVLRALQVKIANETIVTPTETEIENCAKISTTKLYDIIPGVNTNIVGICIARIYQKLRSVYLNKMTNHLQ